MDEKRIDLAALQADVEEAAAELEARRQEASFARSRESDALNRFNRVAGALDTALLRLRQASPSGVDWRK
jgi:hypothetical protein